MALCVNAEATELQKIQLKDHFPLLSQDEVMHVAHTCC